MINEHKDLNNATIGIKFSELTSIDDRDRPERAKMHDLFSIFLDMWV
jgi:hypothetical protein